MSELWPEFHQGSLKCRGSHELLSCLMSKQRKLTAALELCVWARNTRIVTVNNI